MGVYEKILGSLLVGVFFNTFLYGLVTHQFATYHLKKFRDPLWMKLSVFALFIMDTFQTFTLVYMAWLIFSTNISDPAMLTYAPWPYTFTPIGTAFAAIIIHAFLGYRIFLLTKSRVLFGVIILLALGAFSSGLACGIMSQNFDPSQRDSVQNIVTVWLVLQSVTDVTIAVAMSYLLLQAKTQTRYRTTNTVLYRLLQGAIQTGVFSTIFAIGDMTTFLASRDTNIHTIFAFSLGRIYTNSLMSTLNMRDDLKDMLADPVELTLTNRMWASTRYESKQAPARDTANDVTVQAQAPDESSMTKRQADQADSSHSEITFAPKV